MDYNILHICQGFALPTRDKQIDGILKALLATLEKEKLRVKELSKANGDVTDAQYCENFAVQVFNRADKVDRAGRADKGTAMTYYAASFFIDVSPAPFTPCSTLRFLRQNCFIIVVVF